MNDGNWAFAHKMIEFCKGKPQKVKMVRCTSASSVGHGTSPSTPICTLYIFWRVISTLYIHSNKWDPKFLYLSYKIDFLKFFFCFYISFRI